MNKMENNFDWFHDKIESELDAAQFLQNFNIIPAKKLCENDHVMHMRLYSNNVYWRCFKRGCRDSKFSVRKNTWLEGSKTPLTKVIKFIYSWSQEHTSLKFCEKEMKTCSTTVIDYNNHLRKVCASTLLNQPRSLGGEDKTVEIDLTFFNKRKNKDGKMVPDQWIFGGICRETEEVFLCAVPDTTEDVIIQCIKSNIQPGTTIISECHPSYVDIENIEGYQYKHLMVNNRKNFVDLASYANIQKIKNIWSILNERNKKQCGIYRKMLDSYLSEFVWRQRYANKDIFVNILKDIATCHSSNVLHSSLGSKPSVNFEEKAKKRKRSNEESSKSKGSEISSQKNQIKDFQIAENASDSRVKVICHVSPEDLLHIMDDSDNQGTIPERLQSQENSSGNILGQTEDDPLRLSSDDMVRIEGCVNEFELFGKSVANRLNQMPQNKALQLRLRIEELIKNFRQQIFIKPFNVSTSTPPLCDGNVMYFKEEITDDVVE